MALLVFFRGMNVGGHRAAASHGARRELDASEPGAPADVRSHQQRLVRTRALGFSNVRTSGSHRIDAHLAISELVNVQDVGGKVKPYQIRQVRRLVERYKLKLEDAP